MKYEFHRFMREKYEAGSIYTIPEISDGFDASLVTQWNGMQPVGFWTSEVVNGTYEIHVRIRAVEDTDEIYLFTGRKLLKDVIVLKKDEVYERIFYQSAARIIPRYHTRVYKENYLFFSFCTSHPEYVKVESCAAQRCQDAVRVYLCGDSTVTDQSCEIPYHPGGCYASWGQELSAYFEGNCVVQNQAHCGLTTESFREEGHFDLILEQMTPGDFCLFQFGHNDQKLLHLRAQGQYLENLKNFMIQIREKGGIPVLVTPLGRNIWKNEKEYYDLLEDHANAVKQLSDKMDVPCIDLHGASVDFICQCGQKRARDYFHPDDYTHTNEYGAYLAAGYIAESLAAQFPEVFSLRKEMPQLSPPRQVWEDLERTDNRKTDQTEKETFDRMEKSVADLVETIEKVRECWKYENC